MSTFLEKKKKSGRPRVGNKIGTGTVLKVKDKSETLLFKSEKKFATPAEMAMVRFKEALQTFNIDDQSKINWITKAEKMDNLRYLNAEILVIAFIIRDNYIQEDKEIDDEVLNELIGKVIYDTQILEKEEKSLKEKKIFIKYMENIYRYITLIS